MVQWHLAVDIGASSGRAVAGRCENGRIIMQEVYRFPNQAGRINGHLCWAADTLAKETVACLKAAHEKGLMIASVGVDTWGVDYVLLNGQGDRIGQAVSYRDERTKPIVEALEKSTQFNPSSLYRRTGIQFQPFNTIYQLLALQKEAPEQLAEAEAMLMIPDYLHYILTGVKSSEYTNASTTGLLDPHTRDWDWELIDELGLPKKIFQPISQPGRIIGRLTQEVADTVGLNCDVILPATHDTGSAYAAVPTNGRSVFLSSGTWSLLGTEKKEVLCSDAGEIANFTNEGGIENTIRYLKNIMGLWMIQSVRKEECAYRKKDVSFPDLIEEAKAAEGYPGRVNVEADRFLAPSSMKDEIAKACLEQGYPSPANTGEILQCIYQSLAIEYARSVQELEGLTRKTYTSINIVGGGCQDMYLNQLTADKTGLAVYAGPVEGTSLGNLIVQMTACREFADLKEARKAIHQSFDIKEVRPQ